MYKLAIVCTTALAITSSSIAVAAEHPQQKIESRSNIYEVQNFDHLVGNLPGLDDELIKMHLKLYRGYVDNVNLLLKKINELETNNQARTPEFAGLKHMLGWEFDGMLLHESYFGTLGQSQPLKDKDPLMLKIQNDFGSYDNWKADFVATGLMRGIGWVVTYVDPKMGRLVNVWINEHDVGHLSGAKPLLVMDVFEHAYITQFGLERGKYVEVFFNNLNWNEVSKRFSTS
jgi:Fe-Mn family superoxide dismutase